MHTQHGFMEHSCGTSVFWRSWLVIERERVRLGWCMSLICAGWMNVNIHQVQEECSSRCMWEGRGRCTPRAAEATAMTTSTPRPCTTWPPWPTARWSSEPSCGAECSQALSSLSSQSPSSKRRQEGAEIWISCNRHSMIFFIFLFAPKPHL